MASADEDAVVEVGVAVADPGLEVVGVAPGGGSFAAFGGAAEALPDRHRDSLGFGEQSAGAAVVEDLAGGAEDGGDEAGVARHPAGFSGREAGAGVHGRRGESTFEGRQGDGDDDGGAEAAGVGQAVRVEGLDEAAERLTHHPLVRLRGPGGRDSVPSLPSVPSVPVPATWWASAAAGTGARAGGAADRVGEAGVGDGVQGGAEHVGVAGGEGDVEVGGACVVVPGREPGVGVGGVLLGLQPGGFEGFGGVGVDDLQQPSSQDAELVGVEAAGFGEHHLLRPVTDPPAPGSSGAS